MMLLLKHEGWQVLTNSWTVASKYPAGDVTVCYQWGPDRVSWLDSAVSTARVEVRMSLSTFLKLVERSPDGVIDLREFC